MQTPQAFCTIRPDLNRFAQTYSAAFPWLSGPEDRRNYHSLFASDRENSFGC